MKLSDFKPGDHVCYRNNVPFGSGAMEDGMVTSVGEHYVFVRFVGMHPDANGKACRPEDLCKL